MPWYKRLLADTRDGCGMWLFAALVIAIALVLGA